MSNSIQIGRVRPFKSDQYDWKNTYQYEVLELVRYDTVTYLCTKIPPKGTLPTNEEYFVRLGSDASIATNTKAGLVKADGTTITVDANGTISVASVPSSTLPTATTSALGGVKVDGTTITITSDGTISAKGSGSATGNDYATKTELSAGLEGKSDTDHTHSEYLPKAGGTMEGNINFPSTVGIGIKWNEKSTVSPYMGYCSNSADGTFVVSSLTGTTYQTGLAVGGTSGNLLWKGSKIVDISNFNENAASATPKAPGTAAVGTSKKYAREDHVHPAQTGVWSTQKQSTGIVDQSFLANDAISTNLTITKQTSSAVTMTTSGARSVTITAANINESKFITLVLKASSATTMTWNGITKWVDKDEAAPSWGNSGATLVVQIALVGGVVLASTLYNSQA